MIRNTFAFIPGIGKVTEKALWNRGIVTWDDLLEELQLTDQTKTKAKITQDYLQRATDAILAQDISFFAEHLPQKDFWRLYDAFHDRTLFLDIETTGLSRYYDKITLIGTFDGVTPRIFVRNNNFDELQEHLLKYQLLVTFNGKLFDIPFIQKEFPGIRIPQVHIDLRFLLKSVGMPGPLKTVEPKLGLLRPDELRGIDGREAAVVWRRFLNGDDSSLEKLVLYNILDTVNLQPILRYCCQIKAKEAESEMNRVPFQFRLSAKDRPQEVSHRMPPQAFQMPSISSRRRNGVVEIWADDRSPLFSVNRDRIERVTIELDRLIGKIEDRGYAPLAVGIDLTGSEQKASGVCTLGGKQASLDLLKTDDEIATWVAKANPAVVSIDSPLGLPRGRCCADDSCPCRVHGIMRECERILKRRGVNVYPCLIPSMQNLTLRGMRLSARLRELGFLVIESYPGAAQDILGLPRKRVNLAALEVDLLNLGIIPVSNRDSISHDELDALTSALVGYFYLADEYEAVGDMDEELLVIPAIASQIGIEETGGL